MSWYERSWPTYVSVAERKAMAEREAAKLRKKGGIVEPVRIAGNKIVSTFWGKAWCDNLQSYHDYANRLPRGRSYVRNGSVIHLAIAPREITALVMGSVLYRVTIAIAPLEKPHWRSICSGCAGGIDSLVELLQGQLSKSVMERVCRQKSGLFPAPPEIRLSCSCPDYATMCKHVAAVLYGVGARLDEEPELLFHLRGVDAKELVSGADSALALTGKASASSKVLEGDLASIFGLEMEMPEARTRNASSKPAKKPVSRVIAGRAKKRRVLVANAKLPRSARRKESPR